MIERLKEWWRKEKEGIAISTAEKVRSAMAYDFLSRLEVGELAKIVERVQKRHSTMLYSELAAEILGEIDRNRKTL